jgi:hypothetical protein
MADEHAAGGRASATLAWLALAAALVSLPYLLWKGGVLDEEAAVFVRAYWSDSPLAARIFHPAVNDLGMYQARELSYAADLVDAYWFRWWLERGIVTFVPLSSVAGAVLLMLVVAWGARVCCPALSRGPTMLLVALFFTSFPVVTTLAVFFRSAKILTGLGLLAAAFYAYRKLITPRGVGVRSGAVLGLLVLLLCLADRQGFAYAVILTACLGIAWLWTRRGLTLVIACAAAVALAVVYNLWLAPRLVFALNGYWPSFAYQQLSWRKIMNPRFYREGAELLAIHSAALLGGVSPFLVVGGATIGASAWAWRAHATRVTVSSARWLAATLVAFTLASQVAMFAVLIIRNRVVYTLARDYSGYYSFPFQALVLFGLCLGLDRLLRSRDGKWSRYTTVALLALVALNVARLPEGQARIAASDAYGETIRRSSLWRSSVAGGRPDARLAWPYRDLFWECRDRLRSPGWAEVQAREGTGFGRAGLRGGRALVPGRSGATLTLGVPRSGTYRLQAMTLLRPGDVLRVRHAGEVVREVRPEVGTGTGGDAHLSVDLELARGTTVVILESATVSARPDDAGTEAFGLYFPLLLYPVAAPAQPRTVQSFAPRNGRSFSRWSPWTSTAPPLAVPPVPQARLSSEAREARKAALRGRPATTVTVLPPRPFFSSRSTQVIFAGTGSSAPFEQRQSEVGHPHFAQTRPLPVW